MDATSARQRCPRCAGWGWISDIGITAGRETCPACAGSGWIDGGTTVFVIRNVYAAASGIEDPDPPDLRKPRGSRKTYPMPRGRRARRW